MDRFKLEHFYRNHPGRAFPAHSTLSVAESEVLRERLKTRCGLPRNASDLELTKRLVASATVLTNADPQGPDFDLATLLRQLNIRPGEEVLINWHRFDAVDRMQLTDLSTYFGDIWYPDADDLEILDDSCSWILVVPHSGNARLVVLAADGQRRLLE
jgi:hypothetical protein